MIHADISIGNSYRSERIKLMIALATGVFGFTATFHKDLFNASLTPCTLWLVFFGWALLLLSMLAGVFHLWKWEDFYLEHRSTGNAVWRFRTAPTAVEKDKAIADFYKAGAKIKKHQMGYKWWNWAQFLSLGAGMALLAAYVALSGYATVTAPKTPPPPACVACLPASP